MMLTPDVVSEFTEKKIELTKSQMIEIYEYIKTIPRYYLIPLSRRLYAFILEYGNKKLKNHSLGRMIFHLYNHNRLSTYIGLEKLFYAGLIISPSKLFQIISMDKKTQEIAFSLRYIIEMAS